MKKYKIIVGTGLILILSVSVVFAQWKGSANWYKTKQYMKNFNTDIIPDANNSYDLGSSTYKLKNIYVHGTIDTGYISSDGFNLTDDNNSSFGTGEDVYFAWETTGNDNLQIGIDVGAATASGVIAIMEKDDMGNANRSPSSTSSNPALRLYSADVTNADDYVEFYHDQTDVNLNVGSGRLRLYPNAADDDCTDCIRFFDGNDVGDTTDGKAIRVYRRASEADDYFTFYIDQFEQANVVTTTDVLVFVPNTEGIVSYYRAKLRIDGYITAVTNPRYVDLEVDDTDDKFRVSRESTDVVGMDIKLPLTVTDDTGQIAEIGRGTTDTNITYISLYNTDGELCYVYPNADQNGIVVSGAKP
ncbi:MAG: hypothetical protein ACFFG0_09495 [Candidatus Thorarchaeota archaeon]